MKNLTNAPFVEVMRKTTANMYRQVWNERNGGNISYMLDENEAAKYLDLNNMIRTILLGFDATSIIDKICIVACTGKYFKNVGGDPETNLGIVHIGEGGKTVCGFWKRVVMHCNPAHTTAMNYVHESDEKKFLHTLWKMRTECIVVFPDGVGVLPWMLCNTDSISKAIFWFIEAADSA